MVFTYWELFLLDVSVWLACVGLMLVAGGLFALHPAALYFLYHLYTFTYRLFQLANGAPTLLDIPNTSLQAVTPAEIQRAALLGSAVLVTMTLVWLCFAHRTPSRCLCREDCTLYRPFMKELMWAVLFITLPVGLVSLVIFRGHLLTGGAAPSLGAWKSSSYVFSMSQWLGISLLALLFYYGPRWSLLVTMLSYLVVALLVFPFRMMVIIPALFVILTYMRWHDLKWPPPRVIFGVASLALLFVAGKSVGPLLRQGDVANTAQLASRQLLNLQSGTHNDAMFLDMVAAALSQVDEHGGYYYGATHVGLLTLAIPRQWWPNKPGLADWQKDLQTASRPTGAIGAIVTVLGEGYANFGYPGAFGYSILLACLMHRMSVWLTRAPYHSLATFWSLCVYAILIQVFRDGLTSFVAYQVYLFLPLTMITLLHLLLLRRCFSKNGVLIGWSTGHGP